MPPPLILFIDDNATIRKVVEGYLSQMGYRALLAPSAERGLELARTSRPDLILLDHQLPGTTGDQLCRRLLEIDATADIPVVICSAMRNKAFVQYAEFPNVVDQIPKPFTPESLKGGVANALQTGAQVVHAQRTGSALPETYGDEFEPILQGTTSAIPLRSVFDFLNNGQYHGRLVVEAGPDRLCFALGGGRIQAAYSATVAADRLASLLPPDLADLASLLPVTLAEQQDAATASLIKLLERSLADPRRIRALLRFQSAVLMYWALTADPGPFGFEQGNAEPPLFLAFPLNLSLPALAVEGIGRCDHLRDTSGWGDLVYRRPRVAGGNSDRAGLSPIAVKLHAALDGSRDLGSLAEEAGLNLGDVVELVRGLELAGLVERRSDAALVLVVEEDAETVRVIESTLEAEVKGCQYKVVQDRVAAQLLLRRGRFDIILLALDTPEQEQLYTTLRHQSAPGARFIGLVASPSEADLLRLNSIGLDGILDRPVSGEALTATIKHLIETRSLAKVS